MYYLKICFTLLIRKTMNAVTVMFAVMKMIQKTINAVPVMPIKMYWIISKHIMVQCHCCFLWQIWLFVIFGRCCNSKHICSSGFFEFINFNFYATTKSWQAHQKVRLDELVWKEWVSEICMDTFIKLPIRPFQNPLLWHLFVLLK